jgi:alanine dehydrogenase
MKIGVPREVKDHEYRVAITPSGVNELVIAGHEVFIEQDAGLGSAISNQDFTDAGGTLIKDADELWNLADLILKVKEPVEIEYHRLRKNLILFTYLHLAASKSCTDALVNSGITAIAYETITDAKGQLPLLSPMSEVAGRLATQVGAETLMKSKGGRGVLLAGVPGVAPAEVVVIGGGVAGINAARIALGMGAKVTILDNNLARLREIDLSFQGQIKTIISNDYQIQKQVMAADLVIGAVLVPGAKAPKLISNKLVSQMKYGSVLVDIAIDQGGCFEDSRPTTHSDPTFKVHNSIFYCVANMPGSVPHTATQSLTNATLPYVISLANKGLKNALKDDSGFAQGLNVHQGKIAIKAVADEFSYPLVDLKQILD